MDDKQRLFYSLKEKCVKVWDKYRCSPWEYRAEKIARVALITSTEDAYILINMFDVFNQAELRGYLTEEEKSAFATCFTPYATLW